MDNSSGRVPAAFAERVDDLSLIEKANLPWAIAVVVLLIVRLLTKHRAKRCRGRFWLPVLDQRHVD